MKGDPRPDNAFSVEGMFSSVGFYWTIIVFIWSKRIICLFFFTPVKRGWTFFVFLWYKIFLFFLAIMPRASQVGLWGLRQLIRHFFYCIKCLALYRRKKSLFLFSLFFFFSLRWCNCSWWHTIEELYFFVIIAIVTRKARWGAIVGNVVNIEQG